MAIYYCKISELRCHTWKLYISYHFRIYSNFCHSCLASIFFSYCSTEFWTVIIQEFVILHQVSSVQCLRIGHAMVHCGRVFSVLIEKQQRVLCGLYRFSSPTQFFHRILSLLFGQLFLSKKRKFRVWRKRKNVPGEFSCF